MMKRLMLLLLIPSLLLLGCHADTGDDPSGLTEEETGTTSTSHSAIFATENPVPDDKLPVFDETAERYFDYFCANGFISALLDGERPDYGGFSDAAMSRYTLWAMVIEAEREGRRDFEAGFPIEEFDAATRKYFGDTVKEYDNTATLVVEETGRINLHPSDFSSIALVLKELKIGDTGIRTGVFYFVYFGAEGYSPMHKLNLLQGWFEAYGEIGLISLVFEEKTDENGEFYLRYHDLEMLGEAQPPYQVYRGSD